MASSASVRGLSAKRGRWLAAALSLGSHVAIVAALLWLHPQGPRPSEPEPISVALYPGPVLEQAPSPSPAAPAQQAPPNPPPKRDFLRPTLAPPRLPPLPAAEEPAEEPTPELSDAQLAGAATAGSGSGSGAGAGGRSCDMLQWLQAALRKDALVQSEVANARRTPGSAAGKAILVWNGDWVRSHGQDGKGLAAVRQAIMWEIAFKPERCRTEPVRGLVAISLNDSPGAPRLVVGTGEWRWSDLVSLRR